MLHVMTYSRISFWEWLNIRMYYTEEKKSRHWIFRCRGKKKKNYGEIIENSHQSSVKEPMSQKLKRLKGESVCWRIGSRLRVVTERQVTWI